MRIALASPNIRWEDKARNMKVCEGLACQAAGQNAAVIIYPEMTLTGFSMNTKKIAERKGNSPTLAFFSSLSRRYGISVIFGVVWKTGDKATNSLVCLDKKGNVRADYGKIHPFSYVHETRFYCSGSKLVSSRISGVQFGFSICYDLRFPEIFSAAASGTQVFVNIASWPKKRIEHWYALLKARAIENQSYMIGVNRTGKDARGLRYEKSSAIFDANGKDLRPFIGGKDLDIYDLDFKIQRDFRRRYPFRKDKRTQLYRSLYR